MQELTRAADRLARQVGHWTAVRWAQPAPGRPQQRRGDVLHELVQRLADLAAEAQGGPCRPVPRLDSDLVLPDQLRVVAADLAASGAPDAVLAAAAELVTAVRADL